MATKLREPTLPNYEADGVGWAEAQAAALRDRRVDLLDWDNLAEEIDDVGRSRRDRVRSALTVSIAHLLKWDDQPSRRSVSWVIPVSEQRSRVISRLDENPSLRPRLAAMPAKAYRSGRNEAALQMGILSKTLPADCPYSYDEMMTRSIEWNGEIA